MLRRVAALQRTIAFLIVINAVLFASQTTGVFIQSDNATSQRCENVVARTFPPVEEVRRVEIFGGRLAAVSPPRGSPA